VRWTKRQSPLFCSDRSALWHANYLHPPTPKKSGTVNQITQGLDRQTRFILDPADAKKVGHRQSNNSRIRRSITIYTCTRRTPEKSGTASLILELYIWKKSRAPDQEKSGTKIPYSPAQSTGSLFFKRFSNGLLRGYAIAPTHRPARTSPESARPPGEAREHPDSQYERCRGNPSISRGMFGGG
jgi:hypothetical protein